MTAGHILAWLLGVGVAFAAILVVDPLAEALIAVRARQRRLRLARRGRR